MADTEDGSDKSHEVTSAGPLEELWNLAISTSDDHSAPAKSSNEILTELFGAFNAEPPKSLSEGDSDEEGREKKHKKKRKKEKKHRKKTKSKRRLSGELETSSVGCSSESEIDNERRKDRKHKKRKKSRQKHSEVDTDDDHRHGKHVKDDDNKCLPETKAVVNGSEQAESNVASSVQSASPPLPSIKTHTSEDNGVFETMAPPDNTAEKSDKGKFVPGKIVIKDLKFSTVYEATVKEVEEQAKAKAEKYEEGELSDSSSSQKTSDLSDEPGSGLGVETEAGNPTDPPTLTEDQLKHSKRSNSKDKSSSSHKKSRHRSRSRDHDRRSKDTDKDKHTKHQDKDKDTDKIKEKEKEKGKEKDRNKEKDKNKDRNRDRDRGKDRERDRDKRDRDRRRGRSRSRSSHRRRSSSRSRRTRSGGRRRSRSRSKSRSRSRSRRSSGSDHIDKKKLLEIARRNAMNMLQAGILPSTIMGRQPTAPNASVPASKPDKSTAKTVDELTEYCKELSKRENLGELSSLSGSDDSDSEKPFHHPFQVKDRPSFISLNIKNAVQLPLKTLQERTVEQSQLRIQFPVSSGQQHRKTESEWVPVTPQKKPDVTEKKSTLKAIEAPKPEEPKSHSSGEVVDIGTLVSQRLSAMRKMHDSEQHCMNSYMHGWNNSLPGQFTGDTGARVLTPQQLSGGAQAWARKVQTSVCEKAASDHFPDTGGGFCGCLGAQHTSALVSHDQLQTATPVKSGMGMTLLQKMGWRPGEGLGKNKEGCQEPLQLEVKMDRKGLVAAEEIRARRPPPMVTQAAKIAKPIVTTLEGKHPVSLLTEYCSKRHFGPPVFNLCMESGPDHKKDFIFKVCVNGMEYQPDRASPNKKQGKAEAASVCLRALGVLLS